MGLVDFKKRIYRQNKRIVGFALITAIVLVLQWLSTMFAAPQIALRVLETIVFTAIVFLVASVIARLTTKPIQSLMDDMEVESRLILSKLYSMGIYIAGFIVILVHLGVSANNITLVLGFAATGFAFAIRDIISAYMVWFVLLTKRPFRIGDTISVDGTIGQVQHIGTFHVLVDPTPKTVSDYVRIPNVLFIQKSVQNYGKDPIPARFEIHVKGLPASYTKKAAALEKELKHYNATISLDSKDKSLIVACDYTSTLDERVGAQRTIAEKIIRTFNVKQV